MLPPDMFYHPLLKDIPIETALKYVKDGVLSVAAPKSIKKHMTTFSTLMKFGENEDIILKNHAKGLYTEQKKRGRKERGVKRENLQKNSRLPYDEADFKMLLVHLNFDKYRPDRFWAFILALYAGLRIGEACQLYVDDIYEKDGVWVLDIDEKHIDQRVKTEAGLRIIPIHSSVIELGFLWFVASVRTAGHERLFPLLNYSKDDGYKRAAGNYWSRINVKLNGGFLVSKKSFHSLRHNFLNCLKQARVHNHHQVFLQAWESVLATRNQLNC
jgi:integrase